MNALPRQKLVEIVSRHGRGVATHRRRCEGLLRDYCVGYRREVAVLVSAIGERVTADLLAANLRLPGEVLLARLAKRLQDNVAMEAGAARWAVNSWALALGVISDAELQASDNPPPPPAQPAEQKAPAPAVAGSPGATNSPSLSEIVVAADGSGDTKSIRDALSKVGHGGRVLVRPGQYREGIALDKPVTVVGDGAPEEIILASSTASCILMQTDAATVRGLTIRQGASSGGKGFFAVDVPRGRLTLEDCDIASDSLSCVGIHGGAATPVIRRCRMHTSADSGVYVFDGAKATLEDCDIYDCSNVGLAITDGAAPTVKGCTVRQGGNAGVVVWNKGAGLLEGCEIFGNLKAGLGISEGGDPIVRRCRIYGGGNSGVFVHYGGRGRLEECEIYNHAEPEVAVTFGGALSMYGCTVRDGSKSGIFVSDEGTVVIEGCEVSANADAGVSVHAGSVATIRQSRLQDNGEVAVRVLAGGAADVEDCDLTGNGLAAWETEHGAVVNSRRNLT